MRKTIIFGAIAAVLGLAAAAQASNDFAKPAMKDGQQVSQKMETEGRGDRTEAKKREHAEYRERDKHARKHTREYRKEAREREHESGAYGDRD